MSNQEIDQKFRENQFHLDSMKPKFDEVSLCPHCGAQTEEKFSGDEGWTFCSDGCGCLEGDRLDHKFICLNCESICDEEKCNCMTPETVQIKVSENYWYPKPGVKRFMASKKDWDTGDPFGDGDTIQDAIEEFLDTLPEGTKFKWS